MAVTFKVPSSPKRNIEVTDNFLGTDFTNTGVSMEIYRSPNAPNMIRDVPGKVRKRMGYYKEVFFGRDLNLNYAQGTSAQEKEIRIDTAHTLFKAYDLIKPMKSEVGTHTAYIELDIKCEDECHIMVKGALTEEDVWVEISESEANKWVHKSLTFVMEEGDDLTEVYFWSAEVQNVYIKKFLIMMNKDENFEWSPAPEYFVERATTDPIYGCHFLKNGTEGYDGDRVVNVNRVLKSHSTWDEFPYWDYLQDAKTIYYLGETICESQKIYVEFDYDFIVTTPRTPIQKMILTIAGRKVELEPTQGTPAHISLEFAPYTSTYGWCDNTVNLDSTGTLEVGDVGKIKNFSVMYEKNENYVWSPAPEDNDEKFYLKDMYNVAPKNYSAVDNFSIETPAATGLITADYEICNDNSHATSRFQCVSFDLTTSLANSSATLKHIDFRLQESSSYSAIAITESDKHYKNKHFDIYTYINADDSYIKNIHFLITFNSVSSKANIKASNIKVRDFTVRDSFAVSSKWFLYHVGKDFYLRAHDTDKFTLVYEEANEHMSRSWQLNNNSYIIDGKNIYEFSIEDGERVQIIDQENAYIPLVTFAKEPDGGGTANEAINLLQPGFYEQFIGRAGKTVYQLSFDGLDETPVKAWVLDANSNWNPKVEGTDFTVDREAGKVTFTTAPGETPIQGEDSVKILAYRTVEGYRQRITKCTFGTLFGVSGACDRIFLAGNPEHPNWDFYSGYRDGTYYPDTGYSTLGSEQSAITGYAIVSSYLATFKDGFDMSQSVFIREGDILKNEETDESEPVFKLINTLQGEGAIAPFSFGYLQTEPLFLTKAGVYAITEQDITGEKYSQNRSFYLDGKLRKESNLKDAIATVYDNQYVLALNNQLFILDGLQATRTDKSEPYATRQYAGFYCTDIPATCLWTDDQICFGTTDGRICRFYSDEKALESYNDDGKAIYACWETPDLDGKLFYKNKTFRYFAVRIMQAIKTSVKLYSRKLGLWTLNTDTSWTFIKDQTAISNMLDFENFDFDLLSFSADTTERVIHTKLRVKKVDKARFKIENGELNEPFGISDIALEYIESGNYKG